MIIFGAANLEKYLLGDLTGDWLLVEKCPAVLLTRAEKKAI